MDDARHAHRWVPLAAVAVYLGAWWFTRGASFTYDEAIYVELSQHLLESSYYPEVPFLRHPPLSFLLLSAWQAIDLPLRLWGPAWTVPALLLLGRTVAARGGPAWLPLVPVLALPLALPLVTVTPYPPMVLALSVVAWARATGRPLWAMAGWNAAVLVHELALLLLVLIQGLRALRLLQARRWSLGPWLGLAAPYPAAVAWGLVMVATTLTGHDPRGGGLLSQAVSPAGIEATLLKPFHIAVMALGVGPLLLVHWRARDPGATALGVRWGTVLAVLVAPFYRYLATAVPLLTDGAARSTGQAGGRWVPALALTSALLATGLGGAGILTGLDPVNGADVPGLVDHEEGVHLVPGATVTVVRSPPAFAYVLQQDGWTVVSTGPEGPSWLNLTKDGDRVLLRRADTGAEALAFRDVGAHVLPATWSSTVDELKRTGWTVQDRSGGLVLLVPAGDVATTPLQGR